MTVGVDTKNKNYVCDIFVFLDTFSESNVP